MNDNAENDKYMFDEIAFEKALHLSDCGDVNPLKNFFKHTIEFNTTSLNDTIIYFKSELTKLRAQIDIAVDGLREISYRHHYPLCEKAMKDNGTCKCAVGVAKETLSKMENT